ncbi:DUF4435 domain-containing protein [Saprospira grandis]|nr:DUF4435 domain-containing protein [Saprospira grandis]
MMISNDIHECLAAAIMAGSPTILIEGKDDEEVYTNISNELGLTLEFLPIDFVDTTGYGVLGNCDQLVASLRDLDNSCKDPKWIKFIGGVIDLDSRSFANQISRPPRNLYILKMYSIESYFVNQESFIAVFNSLNSAPISNALKDSYYNDFNSFFAPVEEELFWVATEALQNVCGANPSPEITYGVDFSFKGYMQAPSVNPKRQIVDRIQAKKEALRSWLNNAFSTAVIQKQLIIKGKWWLSVFLDIIVEYAKKLEADCSFAPSGPCRYCAIEDKGNCQFKLKVKSPTPAALKAMAYQTSVSDQDPGLCNFLELFN